MAIHYDKKTGRFKDDSGRFVARDKAMRSSIARREYADAQAKTKAPPRPKPAAGKRPAPVPVKKPLRPVVAKDAAPSKAKPPSKKPAPVRVPKPAPAAKKPPVKKKPKKAPPAPPRIYPPHIGEQEGIIEEFPEQWFPDPGSEDDFDWDDIEDIWGDYEDSDTTSAGPDGSEGG